MSQKLYFFNITLKAYVILCRDCYSSEWSAFKKQTLIFLQENVIIHYRKYNSIRTINLWHIPLLDESSDVTIQFVTG